LKRTVGRAQLSLDEARKILGVEPGAAWEIIEKVLALNIITTPTLSDRSSTCCV
jgi:hypothetical protein